MNTNFIVDWQVGVTEKPVGSFVSLLMNGRRAGLYRVKAVMSEGLLLSQGAISFPVGTQLDVEDEQDIVPGGPNHARVVVNDQRGLRLAW
jgi:hypothetical protein